MKEVFVTAYLRFGKSKLFIVCAAAVVLMLLGTIVGLAVSAAGAEVGAQKSDTILLGGEDVPYSEYYQYLLDECLKINERDDLSQSEKASLEMEIAEYRFYLQSNTNTTQYYHDSYGAENGGAYWMQVLFFVGLFASMFLPIVLTAWFLPGAKSGVLRTEFLTGRSRAELWGGKTGAALVASSAAPIVFSLSGRVIGGKPAARLELRDPTGKVLLQIAPKPDEARDFQLDGVRLNRGDRLSFVAVAPDARNFGQFKFEHLQVKLKQPQE